MFLKISGDADGVT